MELEVSLQKRTLRHEFSLVAEKFFKGRELLLSRLPAISTSTRKCCTIDLGNFSRFEACLSGNGEMKPKQAEVDKRPILAAVVIDLEQSVCTADTIELPKSGIFGTFRNAKAHAEFHRTEWARAKAVQWAPPEVKTSAMRSVSGRVEVFFVALSNPDCSSVILMSN